ncbi:unnamed protein product [Blepharisma stoltei]|uniref:Kelch motif family protein n=1 Tax=Blepharisma stoltei TaxID=1481888 RepID=A0AAU9JVD1_9CILI|nr:unnamed protein product [Blepharisma stoltei]
MGENLLKENHLKLFDARTNQSLSTYQEHKISISNPITDLIKGQLESLLNKIQKINSKISCLDAQNKLKCHYCFALPLYDYIIPCYQEIEKWAREVENELNLALFIYQSEDMSKSLYDSNIEIQNYFAIYCSLCQEFLKKSIDIETKFAQELEKEFDIYKSNIITLVNRKSNQTRISFYNIENQSFLCKLINTPEPLSEFTCITQLPNNEIFCFGNNYPVSGVTCIINTNLLTCRALVDGKPCYNSSSIYYNRFVYVFGGCDDYDCLQHAAKYDLSENRWINLTQLPGLALICSCIQFKHKILLSGLGLRSIYSYDPIINSYSVVTNFYLDENALKILILVDSRIYLITQKNLYQSEFLDEFNWTRISDIYMPHYVQIFKVYGNEGVYVGLNYFGINEGNFYHYCLFNIKKKTFDSVNLYKIL